MVVAKITSSQKVFIARHSKILGEIYWDYPRHVARQYAIRCIARAAMMICDERFNGNLDETFTFLHGRVKLYRDSPMIQSKLRNDSMEFIPHLSTWMNSGRYDDDEFEWGYRSKKVHTSLRKRSTDLIITALHEIGGAVRWSDSDKTNRARQLYASCELQDFDDSRVRKLFRELNVHEEHTME